MRLEIELKDISPINALSFSVDLARNAPLCIVGRNGSGKTTLAKTIMNFVFADTFKRTNSTGTLSDSSHVHYRFGDESFDYFYDSSLGTLNTRIPVPEHLKSMISVELPIPHGKRFSYFHTLSDADGEIRREIILERHNRPNELIAFLTRIYGDARFENLLEVKFSRGHCCFYKTPNGRYVREDYFSSGEFFLVNLFRQLKSGNRLVFIDEIDISLDATAQARLVDELRRLCEKFEVNVLFTSHSLALMQTMAEGELLHLETIDDKSTLIDRSFAFIKSVLFGFAGYDRYILVEDDAAQLVIQHHIDHYCGTIFNTYLIISAGTASSVIGLLNRNIKHGFLASQQAVIAILDGDQAGTELSKNPSTYCMPLPSLESAFNNVYSQADFSPKLKDSTALGVPPIGSKGYKKALYKVYRNTAMLSVDEMVERSCKPYLNEIKEFSDRVLTPFLSKLSD